MSKSSSLMRDLKQNKSTVSAYRRNKPYSGQNLFKRRTFAILLKLNSGYDGDHCESELDECEIFQPCQNNAACVDLINDYSCTCEGLYGGKNCSVPLVACGNGHNCSHGAECIPYLVDEANGR